MRRRLRAFTSFSLRPVLCGRSGRLDVRVMLRFRSKLDEVARRLRNTQERANIMDAPSFRRQFEESRRESHYDRQAHSISRRTSNDLNWLGVAGPFVWDCQLSEECCDALSFG